MREGAFVRSATGSFVALALLGAGPSFADLDAIFTTDGTRDRVCLGNGAGGFACGFVSDEDGASEDVAVGLINADPFPDAVFADDPSLPNFPARNRVCLGDGAGGFSCSDVSDDTNRSLGVALGHVNADAHLDAIFANLTTRNRACLGNGAGGFTCVDVDTDSDPSLAVALGHVNADPYLGAVFANGFEPNKVCLGDGGGGFICAPVSPDAANSTDVALGHVDADPHLDAVFSNNSGPFDPLPSRVCLGDGTGGFTCSDLAPGTAGRSGVALGHVDSDSHLDVVLANPFAQNQVCLGDGGGGFSCAAISEKRDITTNVAVGLVDGDGHLDAVFATRQNPNRVCLGDGSGGFVCSDVSEDEEFGEAVALGDFGALPPCTLDLSAYYAAPNLTLDFEIASKVPTTWNVWLSVGGNPFQIVRAPLPVIETPVTVPLAFPLPSLGRVGVLTTLTDSDKEIVCDVRTTVQTGPPGTARATPATGEFAIRAPE